MQTKGVWGSTFSKAWDGTNPNFFRVFFRSVGVLLVNGIFFVPKRKVNITIEDFTEKLRSILVENSGNPEAARNALNGVLEDFYNAKKEPARTYVPHFWFWNNVRHKTVPENIEGSLASLQSTSSLQKADVPDDIWKTVVSEVARIKSIPEDTITIEGNFILDYYFDSLDMAELKASVQSKCASSSNPPITDLKTVADILEMAMGRSKNVEKPKECNWISAPRETETIYDILEQSRNALGDKASILSLFKESFRKSKNDSFVYDSIFGVQSKRDFLLKAYFISSKIKTLQ